MSTAPEPEREASSRTRTRTRTHTRAYVHTHARDVRVRVREISFSVSFSLRGCGGFSFFFISFFVHNSRAAMRRGSAPNPGLRWWLFLAPFWPVHNSGAMSPTTTPQCRPRRHCSVAQDDTNRNNNRKSNRNIEPKGESSGIGFGFRFEGHVRCTGFGYGRQNGG